jgi:hypothetical protein
MGNCAAQLFENITNEQFTCILGKAQAAGINITGNAGTASADGITIVWNFDSAAQTLSIQCTAAPFLVPCGTINSRIHDIVDSCSPLVSGPTFLSTMPLSLRRSECGSRESGNHPSRCREGSGRDPATFGKDPGLLSKLSGRRELLQNVPNRASYRAKHAKSALSVILESGFQ